MGTTAARHGYQIIENARRVLAIECVIALQAAELKGVEGLSPKTRRKYEEFRSIVPSITHDRQFHKDIGSGCTVFKAINLSNDCMSLNRHE